MVNQEKKKKWWDWKHMLYDEMRNWAMWNCTKWMIWEKKKNWLILKKMPRKGKWLIWKKDAQMGKDRDEIDENGLPNINLSIYTT